MFRLTVEVDLVGDADRRGSEPPVPGPGPAPEGEFDRRRLEGVGFIMLSTVSL
jgi:hypothetical protein